MRGEALRRALTERPRRSTANLCHAASQWKCCSQASGERSRQKMMLGIVADGVSLAGPVNRVRQDAISNYLSLPLLVRELDGLTRVTLLPHMRIGRPGARARTARSMAVKEAETSVSAASKARLTSTAFAQALQHPRQGPQQPPLR
jgi:hypothetical protein